MNIANVRTGRFDRSNPLHLYCGRWEHLRRPGAPSLGNPFPVTSSHSRQEVIELYRRDLWARLRKDPALRAFLRGLPEETTLFCHCAPLTCHCAVIARACAWLRSQPA